MAAAVLHLTGAMHPLLMTSRIGLIAWATEATVAAQPCPLVRLFPLMPRDVLLIARASAPRVGGSCQRKR